MYTHWLRRRLWFIAYLYARLVTLGIRISESDGTSLHI